MAKRKLDQLLEQNFFCPLCKNSGAHVERLAMTGTGISRFMDIQGFVYLYASCLNCGFTQVFNPRVLENKEDLEWYLKSLFRNLQRN